MAQSFRCIALETRVLGAIAQNALTHDAAVPTLAEAEWKEKKEERDVGRRERQRNVGSF